MQDNNFIQRARRAIDQAQYISFDIFDTLLVRPYVSPKDLFLHLEEHYACAGFRQERVAAERRARILNPNKQDIIFDDIYVEINPQFQSFKQAEIDLERQVLTANPEMHVLWQFARQQQKRILICTDMYLPRAVLVDVLARNGFADFDALYISGELGKTKKTGALFQHVLTDLNITAQQILHIGDNPKGDFKVPKALGIECLLYPQVLQQYRQVEKKADLYAHSHQSLGQSMILALNAWQWHQRRFSKTDSPTYWQALGYAYAGPLAYGYTHWIAQQAQRQNIGKVLFVARDGYLLQKAFEQIAPQIKHHYVYAPRFLNLICRLDYDVGQPKQAQAIVEYFQMHYTEIDVQARQFNFDHIQAYVSFIQQHLGLFQHYAKLEMQQYQNYLGGFIGNETLAIVDSKTIAFSSQKFIQTALNRKVQGFYWSTLLPDQTHTFDYHEFIPNLQQHKDSNIFTYNWKFVEMMLSSPEAPIQGVSEDGQAIYKSDTHSFDQQLAYNHQQISAGASVFFNDLKRIYGDYRIDFTARDLVSWVNLFCLYPTKQDIQQMSQIEMAADIAHQDYQPLFSVQTSFGAWVKNPKQTFNLIKRAQWRTPTQIWMLNLFRPLKLTKRKSNFLQLAFLPYLSRRILQLSLGLTRHYTVYLQVGNHEENR